MIKFGLSHYKKISFFVGGGGRGEGGGWGGGRGGGGGRGQTPSLQKETTKCRSLGKIF